MRAVAAMVGETAPISVLGVARRLSPMKHTWRLGPLTTEQDQLVTANLEIELCSNGQWRMHGTIRDNGEGAKVTLVVACRFVDADGTGLLFTERTQLNEGEEYPFDREGRSLWLARNWDAVIAGNCRWHLHAEGDGVLEEILAALGMILAAIFVGAAANECNENGSWTYEDNGDGSASATCHLS
ncbi:MAG: hypothetical protein ABMA64_01135 [Myxococcota bacterium]